MPKTRRRRGPWHPEDIDAHDLGGALASPGRVEKAIREFQEALRVSPKEPDIRYDLVMFSRKRQLAAALQLDPGHRAARTVLDRLSLRNGGAARKARP